jgi:predicted GIY-YIG superfamily endonuclease
MTDPRRFVYVIQSVEHPDRYYCGLTSNARTRLEVHNSGGSRHTAALRPWRIVIVLEFANRASAVAFEVPQDWIWPCVRQRHFV